MIGVRTDVRPNKRDEGIRLVFGRRKKGNRARPARRKSLLPIIGYLTFYLCLAGLVTYGIAKTYVFLHNDPRFQIDTIEVVGASDPTKAALHQQLAWCLQQNFFEVELEEVQRQAQKHSWIQDVQVHGYMPRTLRLIVKERETVGLVRQGQQIFAVSEDAKVIASVNDIVTAYNKLNQKAPPLDLPIIEGLGSKKDSEALIAKGLSTLDEIRTTSLLFWDHIERLDLSDEENMIVYLRNVRAPIHLGSEVIPNNIRNYLTIAQHIQQEYASLAYIELGFPNHIAILPKEAP